MLCNYVHPIFNEQAQRQIFISFRVVRATLGTPSLYYLEANPIRFSLTIKHSILAEMRMIT